VAVGDEQTARNLIFTFGIAAGSARSNITACVSCDEVIARRQVAH
jgi:hypothetical protein